MAVDTPAPLSITLAALRSRITRALPAQVREAAGKLTDEQLWWRPNDASNSVGNLILHVTGSLNHYLNRNLGGVAYDRDRAAEFSERGPVPREELLARFEAMVSAAERTFDGLTPERLGQPSPEPKMHAIVIEDVVSVGVHLATHVGQIVWVAKMLTGGSLDDVWMRSHRDGGAWPRPA
jgi:hypothetical protein